MSTNNDATAKQLADMDVQEAQAALAEALELEVSEDEVQASSEPAVPDETGADDDSNDRIVTLPQDVEELGADDLSDQNPFVSAAEFLQHLRMLEALLFAAKEPLDEATMKARLPDGSNIKELLLAIQHQYESKGVNLKKVGRKWRFVTADDVAHILEEERIQPKKLSRAALETLAIIAYHQPCTRAEIEEIRGVAVSKGSLDQLLEIGWVRLRGRRNDTPGRPILYGTSDSFLEHFGLESVSHLPGLADLKAAGLLDARLPPGFTVPTPNDDSGVDESEDAEGAEFVQDFHEDGEGIEPTPEEMMSEEVMDEPEMSDDPVS